MHVTRHDISDVLSGLPEMEQLRFPAPKCDLFVATMGFEERSPYLIERLAKDGSLNESVVLLIEYPTNSSDNEKNREQFLLAGKLAKKVHVLKYSKNDFPSQLKQTLEIYVKDSLGKIIFDLSSCSSYVFYPTVSFLMDLNVELVLLYTEAAIYFPSEEEWQTVARQASLEQTFFRESFENANFQSVGVQDVYPSSLFSEMNPGNRPSAFVAVPNFNTARMNALITRDQELNKTSGDNTYWIVGVPPGKENRWRIEAIRQTNNLSHISPSNICYVSTLNYKDMLKALEEIWLNTRHSHHLSIGSLGSKMQHVGTYFFMCLHGDAGLLLAEPSSFQSANYSSGVGAVWQLALTRTHEIKTLVSRYMTFSWCF